MNDRVIARWRLGSQRLTGAPAPNVPAVVAGLLGVQAENHQQASWAVASRTSGITESEFATLFDEGAILRTHVLRPTWHYVHPDDVRWLLELTAPRIRPSLRQMRGELGLTDDQLDASAEAIVTAISEDGCLTREALGERLLAVGFPATRRHLTVMAFNAELSALICSGPMEGKSHTYALLADRAPAARRLEGDEAAAELALRYFTGHGPATERDLAYWATLTLTDARAAIADAKDRLDHFEHDGRRFWYGQAAPDTGPAEPQAHLLQIFDESYRGYQDSRWVIDADELVSRQREKSTGMVLIDGQIAGEMRRTVRADQVRFDVDLYRDLNDEEGDALRTAADRYAAFLELEPLVVVTEADH